MVPRTKQPSSILWNSLPIIKHGCSVLRMISIFIMLIWRHHPYHKSFSRDYDDISSPFEPQNLLFPPSLESYMGKTCQTIIYSLLANNYRSISQIFSWLNVIDKHFVVEQYVACHSTANNSLPLLTISSIWYNWMLSQYSSLLSTAVSQSILLHM